MANNNCHQKGKPEGGNIKRNYRAEVVLSLLWFNLYFTAADFVMDRCASYGRPRDTKFWPFWDCPWLLRQGHRGKGTVRWPGCGVPWSWVKGIAVSSLCGPHPFPIHFSTCPLNLQTVPSLFSKFLSCTSYPELGLLLRALTEFLVPGQSKSSPISGSRLPLATATHYQRLTNWNPGAWPVYFESGEAIQASILSQEPVDHLLCIQHWLRARPILWMAVMGSRTSNTKCIRPPYSEKRLGR